MYTVETLKTRDSSQRIRAEWWMAQLSSILAPAFSGVGGDPVELVHQRSTQYHVVGWRCAPRMTAAYYVPLVKSTEARADAAASHAALVCFDAREPAASLEGLYSCIVLIIPHDRLRAHSPRSAQEPGTLRLEIDRGVGLILHSQLRLVLQERDHLDAASFDLALDHVLDLLLMAAHPSSMEPSTPVSWTLLASLRQIIKEHAHEPSLNGAELAAQLGWSLRHVQAQLRLHGTTLSDLIREERLKIARLHLKSAESQGLSIGQIAFASGFRDLGTFSNSYQRRYGERPSATRSSSALSRTFASEDAEVAAAAR